MARCLVGVLEERARDVGHREVMLHVAEHQDAARQFYPRLGYTLTGDGLGDQGSDRSFGMAPRRAA